MSAAELGEVAFIGCFTEDNSVDMFRNRSSLVKRDTPADCN